MLKIVVVAIALLPVNVLAQAGDPAMDALTGTIETRAEPMMQSGKLQGCSIVFNSLVKDWKYRSGNYLKVEGSVLIVITETNLGAMLKVVTNAAAMGRDGTLTLTPSPPSRAYLISDDYKTNVDSLIKNGPAETPGGLMSVFSISPTLEMAVQAASINKLTIAFNQLGGQSDIVVPIDLTVSDVDKRGQRIFSSTASTEFLDCLLKLTQNAKAAKTGRLNSNDR